MQQRNATLKSDITEVIIWCIATPVLTVWAMLSLLPIVSVISTWGDPLSGLIGLAFFGTGAGALLAAFAGYRLLFWEYSVAPVMSREGRTKRIALLAGYALIWMSLYGLYSLK